MNIYGFETLKALYKIALNKPFGVAAEVTLDGYYKMYRTYYSGGFSGTQAFSDLTVIQEPIGYLRPQ